MSVHPTGTIITTRRDPEANARIRALMRPHPDPTAAFRAQMARAAHDNRWLTHWPVCPIVPAAQRFTIAGRTFAWESLETGGFKAESGKAAYVVTITDLDTGRSQDFGKVWTRTKRAKSGAVSHTYSQPDVGKAASWGELMVALASRASAHISGRAA